MQRFEDYIRTYRHGRRFLAMADERALVQAGVGGHGLALEDARSAIFNAARRQDIVLQSAIDEEIGQLLAGRAGRRGRITRADFRRAAELYRQQAQGTITAAEAEGRVKDLMQRSGWTPAASGWVWRNRRWFRRIPTPAPDPVVDASRATIAGPVVDALAREIPSPRPPAAGPPVLAGQTPDVGTVLRAWGDALGARDVPAIVRLYAPDALLLATAETRPLRGPAEIRGYFDRLAANTALSVTFDQDLQRLGAEPVIVSGLYTFFWIDRLTGARELTPARYTFVVGPASPQPESPLAGSIRMHHSSAIPGGNHTPPLV